MAAEPGTELWTYPLGWYVECPSVGPDGTVYVTEWRDDGVLQAIHPSEPV